MLSIVCYRCKQLYPCLFLWPGFGPVCAECLKILRDKAAELEVQV